MAISFVSVVTKALRLTGGKYEHRASHESDWQLAVDDQALREDQTGSRLAARSAQRIGHRVGDWPTRAGTVNQRIYAERFGQADLSCRQSYYWTIGYRKKFIFAARQCQMSRAKTPLMKREIWFWNLWITRHYDK